MPCCLWYNPWLCHLSQQHFCLPYNPNPCHPVHGLHQQESTANISLSHLLIAPSMSFPLRLVSSSTIFRATEMVSGPCTWCPRTEDLYHHHCRWVCKYNQLQGQPLQIAFDISQQWHLGLA